MDRSQKIFTVLAMSALIAVLVSEHSKASARRGEMTMRDDDAATIPTDRLGASVNPNSLCDNGPAYLLSNLPRTRVSDNYAPLTSKDCC